MAEIKEFGSKDVGLNAPYIRSLILVRKNDVVSIANPIDGVNSSLGYIFKSEMLKLKPDAIINKINFVWRTCTWSESNNRRAGHCLYENSFSFEVAKNEEPLFKWVLDNEKHEFLALFADRNAQTYIVGNVDVGLELSYSRSIKTKNLINVSLAGSMTVPTFHTEELYLDFIFDSFEFSNEFNTGYEFN